MYNFSLVTSAGQSEFKDWLASGHPAVSPLSIVAVATGLDRSKIRCFLVVDEGTGHALPEAELAAGGGSSPEAVALLGDALVEAARRWVKGFTGFEPQVLRFPSDVGSALAAVDSTVLLIRPSVVRISPDQAEELCDDLENGCNAVIGPTLVGGWYMLALTCGNAKLIDAAGDGGEGSVGQFLSVAQAEPGLEVGILRSERALNGDADLRAAAADPLVEAQIATLLTAITD